MSETADPPPPVVSDSKPGTVSSSLVAILLVAVAAIMLRQAGLWPRLFSSASSAPRVVTPRGDLAASERSTIEIFESASPSVVHITSLAVRRDLNFNELRLPEGTGTGFVWDDQGHIVTNYHVIRSGNRARVTLSDNSPWDARLVGVEPDKDLAVLKIDAPPGKLRAIPVGTSGDLKVGQNVFAIGNPFGLDQTLTTGVIGGLGREIQSQSNQTIEGVIQTDAAINPGNSGGPLLDSAGRLIGVNTAIYSPTGTNAGIGFAVPVDIVNDVVPQLIKHGRIDRPTERPGLGVTLVSDEIARKMEIASGALVAKVHDGSAAMEAGVRSPYQDRAGEWHVDVITSLAGQKIDSVDDISKALRNRKVGETVPLILQRDGEEVTLSITLQPLQPSPR
ncbi:MAG TPA: trypsin-like peptidase domain-containing protein [Planctomycetaceae bacterium]|nr:trypsin-like peptidase domain-containing protein [Planctomycetaceae bacterium]